MPSRPPSRFLIDPTGKEWTVWLISPGTFPPNLRRLLGDEAMTHGALLFVSETNEWRALTPPPPNWLEMTDAELEACLGIARIVHKGESSDER